jgi:hypothetical protein
MYLFPFPFAHYPFFLQVVSYASPRDLRPFELGSKYKGTVELADYLWTILSAHPSQSAQSAAATVGK